MAVDKATLFERIRSLWPQTIFTSDGQNTLNRICETNRASYPVDDNWRQVAIWSFHQALWDLERDARTNDASTFSPSEISFDTFDKWMRSNLSKSKWGPDEWLEERTEWEADDRP